MQGMDLKIKYRNPDENIEKKLNTGLGCIHLFKDPVFGEQGCRICVFCGYAETPDVRIDIEHKQKEMKECHKKWSADKQDKIDNPRCENCKYFSEGVKGIGQCRRDTPKIIEDDYVGQWPGIHSDDWCGEFDLK
jgi:hypothetical protein